MFICSSEWRCIFKLPGRIPLMYTFHCITKINSSICKKSATKKGSLFYLFLSFKIVFMITGLPNSFNWYCYPILDTRNSLIHPPYCLRYPPPWILKQVGQESSGQKLISSNGKWSYSRHVGQSSCLCFCLCVWTIAKHPLPEVKQSSGQRAYL